MPLGLTNPGLGRNTSSWAAGQAGPLGLSRDDSPWGSLAAGGLGALLGGAGGSPLMGIFAVYSLLKSLGIFGDGDDEEQQRQDQEALLRELKPRQPLYQSPFLATADKSVLETLLARLGQTQNWGWPQGNNINLPFLQSILAGGIGSAGGSPIRRLGQSQAPTLRDVIR